MLKIFDPVPLFIQILKDNYLPFNIFDISTKIDDEGLIKWTVK